MDNLKDIDVVVARFDEHGRGVFIDAPAASTHDIPGLVEAAFVWGTDDIPVLPDRIGGATRLEFPGPGGTRFGVICYPPHSAGKMDMHSQAGAGGLDVGSEPGMHRTESLDYEFILSGKIDIVLEGGARRTLSAGSCLVMGGVMHAWENVYDEPCIYGAVIIGAQPLASNEDQTGHG